MTSSINDSDPVASGLTAEGIARMCDEALARAEQIAEQIRFLRDAPDAALSWDATFGMFDQIDHALQQATYIPQLMSVAHPDAAVRDAAMTCEPKADAFASRLYVDDVLFGVLNRFVVASPDLSTNQSVFVKQVLREYRRNGLELDPAGREELRALNEEMTKLGQDFSKHLAETTLAIDVLPAQLAGLPESFVASHPVQENGHVRVTTDYPDLIPFMTYAEDRDAAKELYTQSQNRAAEKNLPILDRLIELRRKKATLLGYATWADYVLEPRMAKNAKTVKAFIDELHDAVQQKKEEEFRVLAHKAVELGRAVGEPIPASDASYLEDQVLKERFALDSQALSHYFDVREVQRGIMEIASRMYGLVFQPADAPTWHEEVMPFDVKDAETGLLRGRVYLDLYPREGKYKHAAVFGLQETMKLADGSRLLPVAALVCNFPKPGAAPALLTHEWVTTFFHEFGHLLHHILSESDLASFAGTCVQRDFVEAPSQLFEEWAWTRETLDLFARHVTTGERIPDDIFNAMTKARTFGMAIWTDRQLFLSALDQAYHTRGPGFDTTRLVEDLSPTYLPFQRVPGTHFQATFGHLVGYDAAYYGYLWALSLAMDLFTRFQEEGMMNQKTAADYRAAILSAGGNDDGDHLVQRFLGRPSNAEAFKKHLGIRSSS